MSNQTQKKVDFLEKQKDFLGESRMILTKYHDYMTEYLYDEDATDSNDVVDDLLNIQEKVKNELEELRERYGSEVDDE